MRKSILSLIFLYTFICPHLFSQDHATELAKINEEGFQNSQVMPLLTSISDVYGPRLTGSKQYYKAANWAKQKLESWGLDKVYFEPYCDECMGWEVNSFNVEMIEPYYMKIYSYPYAWTLSSDGVQEAELVWIEDITDLVKLQNEWQGKLEGKAVLFGRLPKQNMLFDPLSKRLDAETIQNAESTIDPNGQVVGDSYNMNLPANLQNFKKWIGKMDTLYHFFKEEGALAMVNSTPRFPGIIHPSGTYNYHKDDKKIIPYFSIGPEQFGKLQRLILSNTHPKIKFQLGTDMYLEPQNCIDIIGEIIGSDPQLKEEVVMIGAHFDSWHPGSGTTDNGAGSAVMMEVMRIIRATGLKPRRTIRIALWGGEEQGYLGSLAYAKNHFGKLEEKSRKKEVEKISAYLNMDNGAGIMRGIYLQGNEGVRPIFKSLLEPYDYLDVNHLTIENTTGTDHLVFDHYNIPAFQIIQDPLNYGTVTHHTNLDVLDYAPERDLKVNATVLAALAYQIAMKDEQLPRKH